MVSNRTLWRRYASKASLASSIVAAFSNTFSLFLMAHTEMHNGPGILEMKHDPFRRFRDEGAEGRASRDVIPPMLLLDAFVGFCSKHGALTRVALAFRDAIFGVCDRHADSALRAAIRNCIGARGASNFWIEEILCLFRYVSHNIERPKDTTSESPWSRAIGDSDPYSPSSPISLCLKMLISLAYKDSCPFP
jgi:hypothetical protein